ncbi:MAG: hypothetical protein OXG05_06260 [Gammaproteobacteria bacterium]|nr:hypothetical protein [Gammaproteobacteria bacterium]
MSDSDTSTPRLQDIARRLLDIDDLTVEITPFASEKGGFESVDVRVYRPENRDAFDRIAKEIC